MVVNQGQTNGGHHCFGIVGAIDPHFRSRKAMHRVWASAQRYTRAVGVPYARKGRRLSALERPSRVAAEA